MCPFKVKWEQMEEEDHLLTQDRLKIKRNMKTQHRKHKNNAKDRSSQKGYKT